MEQILTEKINQGMIIKALDYSYNKAIDGLPGLDTSEELAQNYLIGDGALEDKAKRLVKWQMAKAGTSGFITGIGGLITMPVAIPANITSVMYVQVRMIASIAVMGGYDIRSDQVKSLVYMCLCGSAVTDIVKDVGINVGTKLSITAINKIWLYVK